jgi:nucleotide-binding universal stress UspA family protein
MLETVVAGYDGSDSARDAVALGEILTEPVLTDLVVARVYPWAPGRSLDGRSVADLGQVAVLVGGRPEVVISDVPVHGLKDLAAELGADLLVVGSSARNGRTTEPGNVGQCLLHDAPCPVAIAPRRFARRYAPDVRTIAVADDRTEEAVAVLRDASRLAQSLRARLRVIAVAAVGDAPRPADVLLEEAAGGADLLVLGSRLGGPPDRGRLGSVSTEVVRKCPCPVLVIPGTTAGTD